MSPQDAFTEADANFRPPDIPTFEVPIVLDPRTIPGWDLLPEEQRQVQKEKRGRKAWVLVCVARLLLFVVLLCIFSGDV